MRLKFRPYEDDFDYWRVRSFVRHLSLLNGWRENTWSLLRWDYWRWHVHENIFRFDLAEVVALWEAGGQTVAMLHPDGPGEAFLQVHPAFGSAALLEEMATRAELHLAQPSADVGQCLRIWVAAKDPDLQSLLVARGY
jgi:mycothiol synthase